MQLLGREKREAIREIEAHLGAEPGPGPRPGTVLLLDSAFEDELHEIEIAPHRETLIPAAENGKRGRRSPPPLVTKALNSER